MYRIDPQGKGYVLFEAPRREITAVAVGANGTIYAASVGDKSHNPLPPLPVQGSGSVTITIVQPGSLQAANTSTSVPEGTEIYAASTQRAQAPRKLWAGKDEIVYALAARTDGLLALTGNRGHVFSIADGWQLCRRCAPGRAAGVEPGGGAGCGRHGRRARLAPATRASCSAGRGGEA